MRIDGKVMAKATTLGLDKFDWDLNYKMTKTAQERSNPNGIPDSGHVKTGSVSIVENHGDPALLVGSGLFNYIRTSPIRKVSEQAGVFTVQTENSTYVLEPVYESEKKEDVK